MKLNAFTLTVWTGFDNIIFEKSYVNESDNKPRNNKAILMGIDFLKTLPKDEEFSVLLVRQEMNGGVRQEMNGGELYNTYSKRTTPEKAINFLTSL